MKISPIDIAALNGDEMDGELWLETGSPWPQTLEDLQTRVDFEDSANFDPVPQQ